MFFFSEFIRVLSKNFSEFWPKNFKKSSKLPSACADEHFLAWRNFKSFESFWIFCRNLRHGSQNSISVSRVKIATETVFLFFFSEFFRILSWNFLRLSAKKLQEFVKTTFCVYRRTIFGLKKLSKFWIFLDFLQKPSAWFSKIYLRVQSKNCVRKSFLIFLFRFFSDFERKIFETFGQKTSWSCQNYLLRVQRNNLWLELFFKFWVVSDFLQKPLAWFSKFYLSVQSKNCGRNSFFCFSFQNLFEFWAKISQNFGQKTSRNRQNYLLRVQTNIF